MYSIIGLLVLIFLLQFVILNMLNQIKSYIVMLYTNQRGKSSQSDHK